MTAEIAIMNKQAVALAADSAVTLGIGQKIFFSANKIFTLSKYEPVGVMVYGSASFMGAPWEIIIKIYRNRLGKRKFETLEGYANHFIDFLSKEKRLFPEIEQEKYVKSNVYGYFQHIMKEINEERDEFLRKQDKITKTQVKMIVSQIIGKHYERFNKIKLLPSMPKNCIRSVVSKYKTIIDKAKDDAFQNLPISQTSHKQLTEIAASLFVKFPNILSGSSGLVIAGFGTEDIFPSLQSFFIDGVADNRLNYKIHRSDKIDLNNYAAIISFAQGEMVSSFMEGIEPSYERFIEKCLSEILEQYPSVIIDDIEKLDNDEKENLKNRLSQIGVKVFTHYEKILKDYRKKNYVDPVMNVVASLPKDELAAMAESLINLTSFKRKVSMEAETVGGPIDVAVISKGDGFVWIKRKHYFKSELNPQFFENYYKERENGGEE